MSYVPRDKIEDEGLEFFPLLFRWWMEACLKGEFGDNEVIYNGGSGQRSRVEGPPFDELFVNPLDNSTPRSFGGFGWGEEDSMYSF